MTDERAHFITTATLRASQTVEPVFIMLALFAGRAPVGMCSPLSVGTSQASGQVPVSFTTSPPPRTATTSRARRNSRSFFLSATELSVYHGNRRPRDSGLDPSNASAKRRDLAPRGKPARRLVGRESRTAPCAGAPR